MIAALARGLAARLFRLRMLAARRIRARLDSEDAAATRISAVARGFAARLFHARLVAADAEAEEAFARIAALQCGWRASSRWGSSYWFARYDRAYHVMEMVASHHGDSAEDDRAVRVAEAHCQAATAVIQAAATRAAAVVRGGLARSRARASGGSGVSSFLVDNTTTTPVPPSLSFSLSPLHSDPEPALDFRTAAPKPQTQASNFLPSSPYRPSGVIPVPVLPISPPLVALPCAAGPSTPHSCPFTEVSSEAESHAELIMANMMASLEGSGSVVVGDR